MIRDAETLRALYGAPSVRAAAKTVDRIDDHVRDFLAASPFALLATSDGARLDVSPKGDAPGFVKPDGEGAVLIPDWPGNNRIDGLMNVVAHPRAGLICLIPGVRETLRINGPATIHDEEDVRARFETRGRLPITVLRIETEEIFLHCAKALIRSKLWNPESWPETRPVATLSDILKDHAGKAAEGAGGEPELEANYARTLY